MVVYDIYYHYPDNSVQFFMYQQFYATFQKRCTKNPVCDQIHHRTRKDDTEAADGFAGLTDRQRGQTSGT